MKSSLINMLLSLTGLCVIAGAALAAVHNLTKEPIARAKEESRRQALSQILPSFDNDPSVEAFEADGLMLYPAKQGNAISGIAAETYSDAGFGGRIVIMAGFDNDGVLTGYTVLSHAETPGLGAKMDEWFRADGTGHNVIGTSSPLAVRADGGDIDAITGATITSRAFTEAVNRARSAVNTVLEK